MLVPSSHLSSAVFDLTMHAFSLCMPFVGESAVETYPLVGKLGLFYCALTDLTNALCFLDLSKIRDRPTKIVSLGFLLWSS